MNTIQSSNPQSRALKTARQSGAPCRGTSHTSEPYRQGGGYGGPGDVGPPATTATRGDLPWR